MKILVLGGTNFVGRHIVEEALKKGHSITLFNRGKSNPSIFPELKKIKGDRRNDAWKLAAENWDAVIDTSAYTPSDLTPVFENVKTEHYTFISTISVYDDFRKGAVSEESSVYGEEVKEEQVTAETYGPLKVMCEQLVREKTNDSALIIRPGIVAGPFDPTDRFTYWAVKLAGTSPVLIPGSRKRKIQWIDARDLASFVIEQVEKKATGTFNVVADPCTMEEFIAAAQTQDIENVWVSDEMLLAKGIQAFELPFWLPVSDDYPEGFLTVSNLKAKKAGLKLRSPEETLRDVREWASEKRELAAGLSEDREKEILAEVQK